MTIKELEKKLKETNEAVDGVLEQIIELRAKMLEHQETPDAHNPGVMGRKKK